MPERACPPSVRRAEDAVAGRPSACRSKEMKRVAILGGGPAGAFAAQQLACAGLKVQLFDEKMAWEKPCGGGLTHKAYSQYPFLIDNSTPKRFVTESSWRLQRRRGHTDFTRSTADLFAHRTEPHAARPRRARRGPVGKGSRAGDGAWPVKPLAAAYQVGYRRGRFLHRRHRRAQSAARRGDAVSARGCHAGPGILCAGRADANQYPVFAEARRVHLDFSALRALVRGHLRQARIRRFPAPPAGELHERTGTNLEGVAVLQPSAALVRNGILA